MFTTFEQQIGKDLDLCDLGMAFTKGKLRARYAAHRKACMAAIREMNRVDGDDELSDADLVAALTA